MYYEVSKMTRLIEEFFGKKAPITRQDLEEFLRTSEESVRLEFKEVKLPQKESIKNRFSSLSLDSLIVPKARVC